MNNPKPDDIRRGQPITAQFLNDSKNAGIHDVRFGAGLVGQRIGDKLVVARGVEPRTRPGLGYRFSFLAEITASSSSSEDHSFVEVDENLVKLTDGKGRESSTAKAFNGRKGVPVTTIVAVWQYAGATDSDQANPQYYFQIPDGLTDGPKDLTGVTDEVSTTEYDIEEDSSPLTYEPGRVFLANDTFSVFNRVITADASGMTTIVSLETRGGLVGDAGLTSLDGHITLRPYAGGPDDKLKVALNEPQADHRTLIFEPGTGVTLDDDGVDSSSIEVEFDDSGRALIANGGADRTITINAAGGGSADGQGYEDIEVNGVRVLAKTDGGIIDFQDKASPTAGHAAVEFSGSAADPQATIEGEVDIDAYLKSLAGYVGGNKQMLGHTNAGVITWFDTAECP